jgi:hypothetical protein
MNTLPRHYGPRCQHCGQPMKTTDDRIHTWRYGATAWLHWRCFLARLRASDEHTAETVECVIH